MSNYLTARPYKPKKGKKICQGGFKYWVIEQYGSYAILGKCDIERLRGAGSALKQNEEAEALIEMIEDYGHVEVYVSE